MNQMSIFDFLKTQPKKHFNPIAEYAMHGSVFVKGKERITKFFSENPKKIRQSYIFEKRIWRRWFWILEQ